MTKYIPSTPTSKQAAFLSLDCREAFFGGACGGGKILSDNGVVLTPFGWKSGKDLKIGDLINNPDGTIQKIIQIKPRVTLPLWRVYFSDGTSTDVAEEHLWLAWKGNKSRKVGNKRTFGKDSAEVVETKTLLEWLNRGYTPQIPVCAAQPFNITYRYRTKIDPYLLGCLLGDGCITGSSRKISFTTGDMDYFTQEFKALSFTSDTKDIRFTGNTYQKLKKDLVKLGLYGCYSNTKFIPREYLYWTIDNRWKLLQGLMDTDGTISKDGAYFSTVSKRLADDVAFLIRSLGGLVTVTTKEPFYYDKNRNKVRGQLAYILYIKVREPEKLFKLPRKKKIAKEWIPQTMNRRVEDIKVSGYITGRCITVSNPNGLYITNDFIVTHNSEALLMGALQYVDIPHYSAILFRRTFSELTLPDSLMFRAHEWLFPFKKTREVHWSEHKKTYTFPSGATLTFGYLESSNDRFRYQSSAYQFIGFDELTHFEQRDYEYLFSRIRRTKKVKDYDVPLRMRSASNPGGPGHQWVKKRFLVEGKEKGRVFIPAIIYDNPYLDTSSYVENLNELNPLERDQLLKGDWEISGGGKIFKREWFETLDRLPDTEQKFIPRVRYWDLAATDSRVSKTYGYDPAYTVGLRMAKYKDINKNDLFVVENVRRFQKTPNDVERLITETAFNDGRNVDIWMEEEPGSSGKKVIEDYRKVLKGFSFRGQKESGSKVLRANRTASTAGAGYIKLLKGHWNDAFLDELEFFPEGKWKDQTDAFSGAFDKLNHYASYSVIPTAVGAESNSYWKV